MTAYPAVMNRFTVAAAAVVLAVFAAVDLHLLLDRVDPPPGHITIVTTAAPNPVGRGAEREDVGSTPTTTTTTTLAPPTTTPQMSPTTTITSTVVVGGPSRPLDSPTTIDPFAGYPEPQTAIDARAFMKALPPDTLSTYCLGVSAFGVVGAADRVPLPFDRNTKIAMLREFCP